MATNNRKGYRKEQRNNAIGRENDAVIRLDEHFERIDDRLEILHYQLARSIAERDDALAREDEGSADRARDTEHGFRGQIAGCEYAQQAARVARTERELVSKMENFFLSLEAILERRTIEFNEALAGRDVPAAERVSDSLNFARSQHLVTREYLQASRRQEN